jgi:dTDP-4-dehydrorhamnose reductase
MTRLDRRASVHYAPSVRLAVTGARGRLGRALVAAAGSDARAWSRPDYELDRPEGAAILLARDRPSLVVHTAAMTDVDACAREPDVALARNALAVETLARACREHGAGLVLVSTNEVFDGERSDGLGYTEVDEPRPRNPYGVSKLAGERAAERIFGQEPGLWIVRTAWLFGPLGRDFPDKVTAAADRLPPGEPLPVVADEFGSPTSTTDLAAAILRLVTTTSGDLFHLVNGGMASRLAWARRVLAVRRPGRTTRAISRTEFVRASDPPPWAVLDASRARAAGVALRSWEEALDDYLHSSDGAKSQSGGSGSV